MRLMFAYFAMTRLIVRPVMELSRSARRVAEGHLEPVRVTPLALPKYLGAPKILPEEILKNDQIGVATGLAVALLLRLAL